jgi:hypothetical protein
MVFFLIILIIFLIILIALKTNNPNNFEVIMNFLENKFSNIAREYENAHLKNKINKHEENSLIYKKTMEKVEKLTENITNIKLPYDILPQNAMI